MTTLAIRQSNTNDNTSDRIANLVKLINDIYAAEEAGMWKETTSGRVVAAEVKTFLEKEQLFFAFLSDELVGSVKIDMIDAETMEFGMLVANPDYRGIGIGRELVKTVENYARDQGYSKMMLELLTPQDWINPGKEFLKKWYTRLGYVPGKTIPFEQEFPRRAKDFACPCDFTVWTKVLI